MTPRTVITDTSPDALTEQRRCIRAMPAVERLKKGCALANRGRRQAIAALKRRFPTADESELRLRFVELAYGKHLAGEVRRWLAEKAS